MSPGRPGRAAGVHPAAEDLRPVSAPKVWPERPLTAVMGCSWPLMAVAVVDDVVRGGIRCSSPRTAPGELVSLVGRQRPDLCLVVTPFGDSLVSVIGQVAQASRSTRLVVLAAEDSPPGDVLAALRAGAQGWLPLGSEGGRLVPTLRAVARGEAAVPRSLMGTVLDELRGTPGRAVRLVDGRACQLSPRELDVLLGLGEGAEHRTGQRPARHRHRDRTRLPRERAQAARGPRPERRHRPGLGSAPRPLRPARPGPRTPAGPLPGRGGAPTPTPPRAGPPG